MKQEHDKKLKEEKVSVSAGMHDRLEPFLSGAEIVDYTDAIPKKPKKPKTEKERAELKWWESFMAKSEPLYERTLSFNQAGLALVMRKGDKKYVVYGEEGKSVGFSNLSKLDKWFKTHYGKK